MLLPALSAAREKARVISCVNRMKQIGLATYMYANDNDDYLPTSFALKFIGQGFEYSKSFSKSGKYEFLVCAGILIRDGYLPGYSGNPEDMYYGPTASDLNFDPKMIYCPSSRGHEIKQDPAYTGIFWWMGPRLANEAWSKDYRPDRLPGTEKQKYLFGDLHYRDTNETVIIKSHKDAFNWCRIDGSVVTLKSDQMYSHVPATGIRFFYPSDALQN